jgi:hypothetical protein
MMKKMGIVVMTALFSVSVVGLSFADEKKHDAAPAATGAPVNPCAGKDDKKAKKAATAAPKKTDKKAEEAPAAAPAPAAVPAKK